MGGDGRGAHGGGTGVAGCPGDDGTEEAAIATCAGMEGGGGGSSVMAQPTPYGVNDEGDGGTTLELG